MRKQYKHGKTSLPLLVTLTGCVLMLACMSPVNATEITKQLSVKGYELSRRNVNELHIVVKNAHDAKNILQSLHLNASSPDFLIQKESNFTFGKNLFSYAEVFSNFVKRSHYENLRSWLMRE
ncbi:MAG TPA: hypothetical protein VFJ43_04120 [Bacteroidia bacterium]|nr:hypothetical protein [Bacteroidia bacterium]